jgi:hypothetical protein
MSEPVAWTNKHNLESITKEGVGSVWIEPYFDGDIPLYTQPMRELTDEEIREVADEVFKEYKNWHHYQIDFARSILKCASGNILSDNEVKD